ncbi:hypothetical protein VTI74DRAFT_2408 [Chaetomium olivicolor]
MRGKWEVCLHLGCCPAKVLRETRSTRRGAVAKLFPNPNPWNGKECRGRPRRSLDRPWDQAPEHGRGVYSENGIRLTVLLAAGKQDLPEQASAHGSWAKDNKICGHDRTKKRTKKRKGTRKIMGYLKFQRHKFTGQHPWRSKGVAENTGGTRAGDLL